MNSCGPLNIKGGVIFWHSVLAIRFFSHFNITERLAPLLDVSNLSGGVLGCAVKQGNRDYRRQLVSEPAREEKIEADVLVSAAIVYVIGGVPGINRRNAIRSSPRFGIFRDFDESAMGINCAGRNLLNGIA